MTGELKTYSRDICEGKWSIDELKNIGNISLYYDNFFTLIGAGPWNKLYLRKIIIDNAIWFDENMNFTEDSIFIIEYLSHIGDLCIIHNALYIYSVQNESSLTRRNSYPKIISQFKDYMRYATKKREFCESINYNYDFTEEIIDTFVFLLKRTVKARATNKIIAKGLESDGVLSYIAGLKVKSFYYKLLRILFINRQFKLIHYITSIKSKIKNLKKVNKIDNSVKINESNLVK